MEPQQQLGKLQLRNTAWEDLSHWIKNGLTAQLQHLGLSEQQLPEKSRHHVAALVQASADEMKAHLNFLFEEELLPEVLRTYSEASQHPGAELAMAAPADPIAAANIQSTSTMIPGGGRENGGPHGVVPPPPPPPHPSPSRQHQNRQLLQQQQQYRIPRYDGKGLDYAPLSGGPRVGGGGGGAALSGEGGAAAASLSAHRSVPSDIPFKPTELPVQQISMWNSNTSMVPDPTRRLTNSSGESPLPLSSLGSEHGGLASLFKATSTQAHNNNGNSNYNLGPFENDSQTAYQRPRRSSLGPIGFLAPAMGQSGEFPTPDFQATRPTSLGQTQLHHNDYLTFQQQQPIAQQDAGAVMAAYYAHHHSADGRQQQQANTDPSDETAIQLQLVSLGLQQQAVQMQMEQQMQLEQQLCQQQRMQQQQQQQQQQHKLQQLIEVSQSQHKQMQQEADMQQRMHCDAIASTGRGGMGHFPGSGSLGPQGTACSGALTSMPVPVSLPLTSMSQLYLAPGSNSAGMLPINAHSAPLTLSQCLAYMGEVDSISGPLSQNNYMHPVYGSGRYSIDIPTSERLIGDLRVDGLSTAQGVHQQYGNEHHAGGVGQLLMEELLEGLVSEDAANLMPPRFMVLPLTVRRRILGLTTPTSVLKVSDFDDKVVGKYAHLVERYGEEKCLNMLSELAGRLKSKMTGMKNGPGYLDVAVSSHLDVLMANRDRPQPSGNVKDCAMSLLCAKTFEDLKQTVEQNSWLRWEFLDENIIHQLKKLPTEVASERLREVTARSFRTVDNISGCIRSILSCRNQSSSVKSMRSSYIAQ